MMHEILKEQLSQLSIFWNRLWFFVPALALVLLSGCAGGGKVQPAPEPAAPPIAVEQGPTVERLADGREGFVIREPASLDAEARQRFDEAVALLEKGEFEQAAALLEPLVEAAPEVTAPYINFALACLQLDRSEEAEEYLRVALDLFPDHPVAANAYGRLLRRQGRFAEARAVYERSLARFPEYLPARRNLGILCELYLDDPACALEQYEIYFAALPRNEQVGIWIAALRLRLGLPSGG